MFAKLFDGFTELRLGVVVADAAVQRRYLEKIAAEMLFTVIQSSVKKEADLWVSLTSWMATNADVMMT